MPRYEVVFYKDILGRNPVELWVDGIREAKNQGSKQARVHYNAIYHKIELLKIMGTLAGFEKITNFVWEFRAKDSRILYGECGEYFVLLHYIEKKDYNKLRQNDIDLAQTRMVDWMDRNKECS